MMDEVVTPTEPKQEPSTHEQVTKTQFLLTMDGAEVS